MNSVLMRCAKMMRSWMLMQYLEDGAKLEGIARAFEERSARPPRLIWKTTSGSSVSDECLICNDDVIEDSGMNCDVLDVNQPDFQADPDDVTHIELGFV
jgi:hypothetical protein